MFFRIGVLKNFVHFTRKHRCESLFNKVASLNTCNFIKKSLRHRCFPLKCTKFLRTPFFTEHLQGAASGRRFWMRPLFADRETSGAYQSLVLEMKEIEI